MEITKKAFLKLPNSTGVYTFWKNNTIIYIGKSVNLKSRLNSYLTLKLESKTAQMISEATKVTIAKVNSDIESLLLESYLINKHKPKYNIVLKDDKHALYIKITKDKFPRVITSRKSGDFGPFPSSLNVKIILKLVRKIFPFSDHKITTNKVNIKPCLYNHIGLCNPCPNLGINRDIYLKNIRNIKLVLSRKFNIVRKTLEKEMISLSKLEKYEEAKIIRDRIKVLDYITQEKRITQEFLENPNLVEDVRKIEITDLKKVINHYHLIKCINLERIECFDVSHISGINTTASMVVLINGEVENNQYRHFKIEQKNTRSDYDSMKEVATRRMNNLKKWGTPNLIIVDGGILQVKVFTSIFDEIKIPVVGISKNPDKLVFPDGTKVKLDGNVLNILSRIRNEAHRFAQRYHHKLVSKTLLTGVN